MATTRIWLGGTSYTSNPANWSPAGTPQPGEPLLVRPASVHGIQAFIMNVSGNDLAGDTVSIGVPPFAGPRTNFKANLSHHATMRASSVETDGIFNLSQHSSLNLSLYYGYQVGTTTATINITGSNRLTLDSQGAPATINLAPGATWSGTFKAEMGASPWFPSSVTVNGQPRSSFNNDGASSVTEGSVTLGTDVTGHGSFDVSTQLYAASKSRLEFIGSVGSGQSITDAAQVVVDLPKEFAAHVTLKAGGELDLNGLTKTDSYTFRNDILSLYSGPTVVDRVHLTDQTPYGFIVSNVAGNTEIVAAIDPAGAAIELPVHG